jgi:hypothetical protein
MRGSGLVQVFVVGIIMQCALAMRGSSQITNSHEQSDQYYLFDRAICTGLGGRVGTMLTLAALGRRHSAKVVFRWCEDGSEISDRILPHIPRWRGYNYSLAEFKTRFRPPSDVVLVEQITDALKKLPRVQWLGVGIPAEQGSDSVYTTAWKTTRLGNMPISAYKFKASYQAVARPFAARAFESENRRGRYVAVHLRSPDNNTYWPPDGAWDDLTLYCTGKVLRKLLAENVTLVAISNNKEWADEVLGGRLRVQEFVSAYDDFSLLLGASGIVQHAWGGWSSFSTVPALASGAALINTFRGVPHR